MEYLNQSALARLMGVTPKTVSIWKSGDKLVMKGNLVDVEATRARFLKYSRTHSKALIGAKKLGNNGAEPLPAAVSAADKGNTPPRARYADGADYETHSNLPPEVTELVACIEDGAFDLAAVLISHLPMVTIIDIVREWTGRMRRGWVGGPGLPDTPADMEWPAPPLGLTHWCQHPYFSHDPVAELDWLSLGQEFPEHAKDMPK